MGGVGRGSKLGGPVALGICATSDTPSEKVGCAGEGSNLRGSRLKGNHGIPPRSRQRPLAPLPNGAGWGGVPLVLDVRQANVGPRAWERGAGLRGPESGRMLPHHKYTPGQEPNRFRTPAAGRSRMPLDVDEKPPAPPLARWRGEDEMVSSDRKVDGSRGARRQALSRARDGGARGGGLPWTPLLQVMSPSREQLRQWQAIAGDIYDDTGGGGLDGPGAVDLRYGHDRERGAEDGGKREQGLGEVEPLQISTRGGGAGLEGHEAEKEGQTVQQTGVVCAASACKIKRPSLIHAPHIRGGRVGEASAVGSRHRAGVSPEKRLGAHEGETRGVMVVTDDVSGLPPEIAQARLQRKMMSDVWSGLQRACEGVYIGGVVAACREGGSCTCVLSAVHTHARERGAWDGERERQRERGRGEGGCGGEHPVHHDADSCDGNSDTARGRDHPHRQRDAQREGFFPALLHVPARSGQRHGLRAPGSTLGGGLHLHCFGGRQWWPCHGALLSGSVSQRFACHLLDDEKIPHDLDGGLPRAQDLTRLHRTQLHLLAAARRCACVCPACSCAS